MPKDDESMSESGATAPGEAAPAAPIATEGAPAEAAPTKIDDLVKEAKQLGVWDPEDVDGMKDSWVRRYLTKMIAKEKVHRKESELQRKESESKDAQLELQDAQLESKDAQLELQRKESELQAKQLESKDAQLELQDALVDACMKSAYANSEGKFTLPKLQLRPKKPSTRGNSQSTTETLEDGETITTTRKIPTAEIIELQEGKAGAVWLTPKAMKLNFNTREGRLLPSAIGTLMKTYPNGFIYANEFDIQLFVRGLVSDAISLLHLEHKVMAHLEVTIYTMKPDMVIVLRERGCMIFTIEVKCPGQNDEVFESKNAAGQIWCYLMAMKQLGVEKPIGAIMTYDKMVLVTLEDYKADKDHQAILKEAGTILTNEKRHFDWNKPDPEQECQKKTSSPIKIHKNVSKMVMPKKAATEKLFDDKDTVIPPQIYRSKILKHGEVFPSLVQALAIACLHSQKCDSLKELPVVHHGDNIGNRLFFRNCKDGYDWVVTPSNLPAGKGKKKKKEKLCANANEAPALNTKYFYMLNTIGKGQNGVVYVACSSSGKLCAIKVYNTERSTASLQSEREKEDRKEIEKCFTNAASEEEDRWKELYNERWSCASRRKLYLNGRPCLLIPYGVAIDSVTERTKRIEDIEKELTRFASGVPHATTKKRVHYRYQKSDLRWRHILLCNEGKVFLSDLGSLETFDPEKDTVDNVVKSQMTILRKSIEIDSVGDGRVAASPTGTSTGKKRSVDQI